MTLRRVPRRERGERIVRITEEEVAVVVEWVLIASRSPDPYEEYGATAESPGKVVLPEQLEGSVSAGMIRRFRRVAE